MVKQSIKENFIKKNQNIRDCLFKPIIKILAKLNITANFLSNLKLIGFLPFLFLIQKNQKLAFIFLLISLIIDLFDGSLARFQKKQSDKGKFIDIFGDFLIYLLVVLSLISLNTLNKNILTYHLFIFPIISILSTIKNQEFTKTDWIIKPAPLIGHFNALVYISLFLLIFFKINFIHLILYFLNLYYSILSVYNFIFIQNRWLKK